MQGVPVKMKKLVLAISLISLFSQAEVKVIYGTDNRVEAALSTNKDLRNISMSVAARIPKKDLPIKNGVYELPAGTLASVMEVCESEPFAQQSVAAECSGFLIGPDTLVTAGHCMRDMTFCNGNFWVFDYLKDTKTLAPDQVFECKKIIAQELSPKNDFAIIQLAKVPLGRTPLKLRTEGIIPASADLAVIGYPWGLPLKIDDGGIVRDVNAKENFFVAELDTYGGNSGSPVVNVKSLEVEGILVRGEKDSVFDVAEGCYRSKICPTGTCRGEDSTRITSLPLNKLHL